MTPTEWLARRMGDVATRENENSLITVGAAKPLGSQGFPTDDMANATIALCPPPAKQYIFDRTANGTWVYLWDPEALPALLEAHRDVLEDAQWPVLPGMDGFEALTEGVAGAFAGKSELAGKSIDDGVQMVELDAFKIGYAFVTFVRGAPTEPRTALYDLIADAFGDKLNPGRTDFDLDVAVCLKAYYKRVKLPDPTTVYFMGVDDARIARAATKIMNHAVRRRQRAATPKRRRNRWR